MGGCPLHCRILNSIPGFYLPDDSSTPSPTVITRNNPRHCPVSFGGQNRSDSEPLKADSQSEKPCTYASLNQIHIYNRKLDLKKPEKESKVWEG